MTADNFKTYNQNFSKLFSNGVTYRIPRFQRDYSWGEDDWHELWADIIETTKVNGEPAHYMGYLVLQTNDNKTFDVIDGQQRLTTLSIIILAAIKNLQNLALDAQDNTPSIQRAQGLRSSFIGSLDTVSLTTKSKLKLNRHCDFYYQNNLVPLKDNPSEIRIKSSEKSLRDAYFYFIEKIKNHVSNERDKSLAIAKFIDDMAFKLFFTVIEVKDELNAYKVFETLNARGVKLSTTDLLKNYLYLTLSRNKVDDNELDSLDERWNNIVSRLGEERFSVFLRYHWNSRHSLVREKELFKEIKDHYKSRKDIYDLLINIDSDIDTYLGLTNPFESNFSKESQEYANILGLFEITQPFPLLMAVHRHFSPQDFDALLRWIVIISFRYNIICKLPNNEQERKYNNAAVKVTSGRAKKLNDLVDDLRPIYPNDALFSEAFSQKTFNIQRTKNVKILRYIFGKIGEIKSQPPIDFDNSKISIEHIFPQNPEKPWEGFDYQNSESLIQRIGNMTLLEQNKNTKIGNKDYPTKCEVYTSSSYVLTKEIAQDHSEWSPNSINHRQKDLAKLAANVWRIQQLSQ